MKHKHDHKLVTRRDFLSQGIIQFGAAVSMPTVLGGMLGVGYNNVFAADCGGVNGSTLTPFLVFDMAGGAALPGNFLVGKKGGPEDLLSSYNQLGWDPRESGALNKDFGLPLSAKYSKLLTGILANASADARKNFRMGSFCHFGQDDTSTNKLNIASLIMRTGFRGTLLSNGVGLRDSASGGNSAPVYSNLAYKPTRIGNINDLLGSTSFGGSAFKGTKIDYLKQLAQSGLNLSKIQKNDTITLPDGQVLADLSQCAYEKSVTLLENTAGLDPRLDPVAQAVYQINQNTAQDSAAAVSAAVAVNTIRGYSGPSIYTLGGCDYHDGTQTTGDARDGDMGVIIGRAVEAAHRIQKPLFFQLITDGGCDSEIGSRKWRGDSGTKSMTVIGYYNPKGAPKMVRTQVGHYTNGQAADNTTLIGNEPALVGYAVLANYLNIHGKLADFATYAPGVFTETGKLESVLIFGQNDSEGYGPEVV